MGDVKPSDHLQEVKRLRDALEAVINEANHYINGNVITNIAKEALKEG